MTFAFNATPMILCANSADVIDFASVDFSDKKALENLATKSRGALKSILKNDVNVRSRLRGILDDIIDANIL